MAHSEEGFTFQLEEVLSFERGQEVGDMISVFLDPDITVQSFEEDISIRGLIELQGEYVRADGQIENEDQLLRANTFEYRNYVDKVVDIGEERAIFSHHFPVEISIPHYRVANVEDISMEIEHFDYELISPDEMRVQSSIIIHGVNDEEREYFSLDTHEEDDALFTITQEVEEQHSDPPSSVERSPLPEEDGEVMQEVQSHPDDEVVSRESEEVVEEVLEEVLEEHIEDEQEQLHVTTRSQDEHENTSESTDPEQDEEDVQDNRNIDYLMSMFDDEDENEHTKVRLCIVQERDTVDSIAERYNVKKIQILKKNKLENEELEEGQLLQIPFSSKS